jgi:hypothetical protein
MIGVYGTDIPWPDCAPGSFLFSEPLEGVGGLVLVSNRQGAIQVLSRRLRSLPGQTESQASFLTRVPRRGRSNTFTRKKDIIKHICPRDHASK